MDKRSDLLKRHPINREFTPQNILIYKNESKWASNKICAAIRDRNGGKNPFRPNSKL